MTDQVHLTGYIPERDLPAFLSCADLFILPSIALEGFGLVVLESMACGTPVMVSPLGGAREAVQLFDKKYILRSPAAEDISEAIMTWMHESTAQDLRASTRNKARAFVESGFSWDAFARNIRQELII